MRRLGLIGLAAVSACKATPEANVPPVAQAGWDQAAALGDTVTLDATASHDPDAPKAALSFEWRVIAMPAASSAVLSAPATARPSFVADQEGTYLFWLTVTDAEGATSLPDVVAVTARRYLTVERVVPVDLATEVSPTSPILIELSEPVQVDTVSADTILLTDDAGPVPGSLYVEDGHRLVVFSPLAPLAPQMRHVVLVGYGVRNLRGLSVAIPFESEFTTAAGGDVVPPTVIEALPTGAGVPTSASVRITFSEPVTPASATSRLTLTGQSGVVTGGAVFSGAGMRLTFTPDALLLAGESYDMALAAGVTDLAGNPTSAGTAQSFTTDSAADIVRPAVLSLDPAPGFTDVGVQARVVATFSEVVEPASVGAATFVVSDGGGQVAGAYALSVGNTVATFTPAAALAYDTTYTIVLTTGITDRTGLALDGNGIGGDWSSGFVTVALTQNLDHFRVEAAPTVLEVGGTATITMRAEDIQGDAILGYDNVQPILLTHTGSAIATFWSGVGVVDHGDGTGEFNGAFANGVARVQLTDLTPEGPVIITVSEQDTVLPALPRTGSTQASGTNVVWTPGSLAQFAVVPNLTTLVAGGAVTLTITAQDAVGNTIDTYANTGSLRLDQSGAVNGKIWSGSGCLGIADGSGDNTLGAGCFFGGSTQVTLTNRVAEGPITVTVSESDAPAPDASGTSAGMTWEPDVIDSFWVVAAAPWARSAGDSVDVTLSALDRWGNLIASYTNVLDLSLTLSGGVSQGKTWSGGCVTDNGNGTAALAAGCWAGGELTVSIGNTVAEGPVAVIATENDTGRSGSTAGTGTNVTWTPGALDHFVVTAAPPLTRTAGESVALAVLAQDAFANTVTSYTNVQPIVLEQSGSAGGKAWDGPCVNIAGGSEAGGGNQLNAGCWVSGSIALSLENTRAEGPLTVRVTEADSGANRTGVSAGVTWSPGPLDHFRVEAAPVTLVVGALSTITMTAEDFYANPIPTYVNAAPNELTQNAGATGLTWSGACVTNNGDGTGLLANTCWMLGAATVQLANTQAEGPVRISVTDPQLLRTGNTGISGTNVTWLAGAIDHFLVEASPLSLPAGSATTVTLTAADLYNNPIASYAAADLIDVAVSCPGACAGNFTFSGTGVGDLGNVATITGAQFDSLGRFSFDVSDSTNDTSVNISATERAGGPAGSTAAGVSWNSTCPPPYAVPQLTGVTNCTVQLDASGSFDGGSSPLAYAWTFLSVPTGSGVTSAALTPSASDVSPAFVADLEGDYILKLSVTNACGSSHNEFLAVPYAMSVVAGDIRINEVVTSARTDWNGGGGVPNNNDEYVELYNASSCVRSLAGWTISFLDNNALFYTFGTPLSGRILSNPNAVANFPPGSYLVLLDPNGSGAGVQNDVYMTLVSDASLLIDDVELGSDPENDGDDGAPNGGGAGGANNNVADECVARVPNATDTDNDIDDFCRCACTFAAANCAACFSP